MTEPVVMSSVDPSALQQAHISVNFTVCASDPADSSAPQMLTPFPTPLRVAVEVFWASGRSAFTYAWLISEGLPGRRPFWASGSAVSAQPDHLSHAMVAVSPAPEDDE